MKTYTAPWSRLLVVTSCVATAFCFGISALPFLVPVFHAAGIEWLLAAVALIPIACLPFIIRGYAVLPDAILIRRLLWWTRVPLVEPLEINADPTALKQAIRICGNGGLFSFTGWFWSRKLGKWRAFVNDPARCVVLRTGGRTFVLSPEDPDAFVRAVWRRIAVPHDDSAIP